MLRKGPTSLLEVGPFVYSLRHRFPDVFLILMILFFFFLHYHHTTDFPSVCPDFVQLFKRYTQKGICFDAVTSSLFLSIISMAVKSVKNPDKSCLVYRFLIIGLIRHLHAYR